MAFFLVFIVGILFGIILGILISTLFDKWSAQLAKWIMKKLSPIKEGTK